MIPPVPLRRVYPPNPDPAESILEQLTLGSDGFIPLLGDPCSEYPPSNGVKPLLLSKTVTMMAERTQHVNDFTASDVDFFTSRPTPLRQIRDIRYQEAIFQQCSGGFIPPSLGWGQHCLP